MLVLFHLVTIDNYEGYWIQTNQNESVLCSKQNDSILNCETERCTMNCHDTYEIGNVRIISTRDSNAIGHFDCYGGIRWENNITWIRKG